MDLLADSDEYCARFLEQTNRPFDFVENAMIPDGYPIPITRLIDFDDRNGFVLPSSNTSTVSVAYVGFILSYGTNDIGGNCDYFSSTASTGSIATPIYAPIWFFCDSNCVIQDWATGVVTGPWSTYGTQNYDNICGATFNTGVNTDVSLASSLRMISAGIRIWPQIELATNSSTLYVAQYYGCSILMKNLAALYDNATSVVSAMKESPDFNQFSNSEGMCARIDVAQSAPINPVKFYDLDSLNNINLNTNGVMFPLVLVQLSAPQTWTTTQTLPIPINCRFQYNFESILSKPTPIVSILAPLSLDWEKCLQVLQYMKDDFPLIVQGHSFAKFAKTIGKVVKNPLVQSVATGIIKSNPLTSSIYDTTKGIVKATGLNKVLQGNTRDLTRDMSNYAVNTALSFEPKKPVEALRRFKQSAQTFLSKNKKKKKAKNTRQMPYQPYGQQQRMNEVNAKAGKNGGFVWTKVPIKGR